jgi:hypothetical protein
MICSALATELALQLLLLLPPVAVLHLFNVSQDSTASVLAQLELANQVSLKVLHAPHLPPPQPSSGPIQDAIKTTMLYLASPASV